MDLSAFLPFHAHNNILSILLSPLIIQLAVQTRDPPCHSLVKGLDEQRRYGYLRHLSFVFRSITNDFASRHSRFVASPTLAELSFLTLFSTQTLFQRNSIRDLHLRPTQLVIAKAISGQV